MDMTQDTWGALSWSQGNWSEQNDNLIIPTGFSITATLGEDSFLIPKKDGVEVHGGLMTGVILELTVVPTGYSMNGSLGTLAASIRIKVGAEHEWGIGNLGARITSTVISVSRIRND